MTAVGSDVTRLVVIRGNSSSGKSTIARSLRASLPRGVAIVGQDQIRREILQVRDLDGTPAIDLVDLTARFALDHGLHVVVEGILYPGRYDAMLRGLKQDHRGITRCYLMDVPFPETLRRHDTKPIAGEYGETEMRSWWVDPQLIPGLDEQVITGASSLEVSVARIRADCGW